MKCGLSVTRWWPAGTAAGAVSPSFSLSWFLSDTVGHSMLLGPKPFVFPLGGHVLATSGGCFDAMTNENSLYSRKQSRNTWDCYYG